MLNINHQHYVAIQISLVFTVVLLGYVQWLPLDFIGHMLGFYFLSWLVHRLCQFPITSTTWALIVYSAMTELAQGYLGFRNGELSDFFADTIGVLLYFFLFQMRIQLEQK